MFKNDFKLINLIKVIKLREKDVHNNNYIQYAVRNLIDLIKCDDKLGGDPLQRLEGGIPSSTHPGRWMGASNGQDHFVLFFNFFYKII